MISELNAKYVVHVGSHKSVDDKENNEWKPRYMFFISELSFHRRVSHERIVKSEEDIETIEEAVELARTYLNEYLDNILAFEVEDQRKRRGYKGYG